MKIINSNNIDALKDYPDNYFDAVVTDPPYGLGKEPNAEALMRDWIEKGYHEVGGSGFMGKEWDAFVPQPIFWKEVFRVLKHGGHVLSFFGTRTYDWGVMAMRFAGFEVRDCIQWLYGSGFPKSFNISKAIDKMYGAEREIVGEKVRGDVQKAKENGSGYLSDPANRNNEKQFGYGTELITKASTEQAKEWEGWGSALKPANEPIVLARKPLEKGLSIAENVLKWGVGGINIDGCRVGTTDDLAKNYNSIRKSDDEMGERGYKMGFRQGKDSKAEATDSTSLGRFPANLILTHHPECECIGTKKVGNGKDGGYNYEGNVYEVEGFVPKNSPNANSNYGQETVEDWNCHPDCPIKILDEQSGILNKQGISKTDNKSGWQNKYVGGDDVKSVERKLYLDTGGASRFFYCAKASKSERNKGLQSQLGERETPMSGRGQGGLKCNLCNKWKNSGNPCNCENPDFTEIKFNSKPNFNGHPTVKPIKLMQYLVRLVTPPNGIVLDPFCGSGTTGVACKLEGFEFVGIEQDAEYCKIAEARIEAYVPEIEDSKEIEENTNRFTQLSLF